ncbi:MAG: inositol monophosphatase family protein [Gemmatimonadota bacterium]|nr:inositol monophosphatase family protein [Gemmatimonadota bacterium]
MDELDTAEALAVAREATAEGIAALEEARERTGRGQAAEKRPRDLVTEADHEAERRIVARLREAFPGHAYLAEEGGGEKGGRYRWVIDPLDGTTNYVHDFPVYAVSVALFDDEEPVVGIVVDVARGEWFTGRAGAGAAVDRGDPGEARPISVSENDRLPTALLATGFPFRYPEQLDRYLDTFRALFRQTSDVRRAGSAALDLAWVASGRVDGFWELGLSLWDIAAGELLVLEAGGRVTDWAGGTSHRESGWIASGNPTVHDAIVRTLEPWAP